MMYYAHEDIHEEIYVMPLSLITTWLMHMHIVCVHLYAHDSKKHADNRGHVDYLIRYSMRRETKDNSHCCCASRCVSVCFPRRIIQQDVITAELAP